MYKNIAILGSTGSIGKQALEVCDLLGINVCVLSANKNIDLLSEQILKFKPKLVAVTDEEKGEILKERFKNRNFEIVTGKDALCEAATFPDSDIVLTSVVGNSGLKPTFLAMDEKKDIALANKETLVSAGELFMNKAREKEIKILPVDSEHSAIFQSLQGNFQNKIRRIILTASGGPFRGKKLGDLKNITVKDALNHPNWSMGQKITIDSATLMNKGLEVIEAKWLFGVDISQIEVVVHPQSIVHSAVEYEDGSIIAQMGVPDMKVPIQYALTYPDRLKNGFKKLSFDDLLTLTFEKPDKETFKCLNLAYKALEIGGTMTTVLNAANEFAVYRFLDNKIKFTDIPNIIETVMNEYTVKYNYDLQDLLDADEWARKFCEKQYK